MLLLEAGYSQKEGTVSMHEAAESIGLCRENRYTQTASYQLHVLCERKQIIGTGRRFPQSLFLRYVQKVQVLSGLWNV